MVNCGAVRKVEEEATWPSHWDGGKESPPMPASRSESSVAVATAPAEAPAALVLGAVAVVMAIVLGAISQLATLVG